MKEIIMQGYECKRCNHKWIPRIHIKALPTVCPQCKSPYWNRERRKS